MIVQWTTNAQAAGAVVQYGTRSGTYTGSAAATATTYTASDMCGGEAATTGYLFPGETMVHNDDTPTCPQAVINAVPQAMQCCGC